MKRRAVFLVLAAMLAVSFVAAEDNQPSGGSQSGTQQSKKADPRVEETLKRLGVHYTVNTSGNVAVTYDLDGGRSQTVYIMSKTDEYNNVEIREIWSNAGTFDAEPDADGLINLMTESGKNKIGCWALEKQDDGKYLLFYTIKMPAESSDEAYRMALEFASAVADACEKELFNSDEN